MEPEIIELRKQLLEKQTKKIRFVQRLLEPGFLPIEEELKDFGDDEKKKKKIKLTHSLMNAFMKVINKQKETIPSQYPNSSKIKTALSNEISICDDILELENVTKIIAKLRELITRIERTTEEIKSS